MFIVHLWEVYAFHSRKIVILCHRLKYRKILWYNDLIRDRKQQNKEETNNV